MRKEPDLARVKRIAHVLLDMPIAQTLFSPAVPTPATASSAGEGTAATCGPGWKGPMGGKIVIEEEI